MKQHPEILMSGQSNTCIPLPNILTSRQSIHTCPPHLHEKERH